MKLATRYDGDNADEEQNKNSNQDKFFDFNTAGSSPPGKQQTTANLLGSPGDTKNQPAAFDFGNAGSGQGQSHNQISSAAGSGFSFDFAGNEASSNP